MPPTDNPPPPNPAAKPGRAPVPDLAGFLVIDKPHGLSSMQAIARVRRKAGRARTGHAGTLDPLATGVLVVAIGRPATRLIERFMSTSKRYRTEVDLSAFTTTDDREGEREEITVGTPPSREAVEQALAQFVGDIQQRPPTFSAIKIDGKRAYKLARGGDAREMKARTVTIHDATLHDYAWPIADIELLTAKGVYVRSVARDLGAALGTGGHCATLRRTAVGPFDESVAVAPDDLPDPLTQQDLIDIEHALGMLEP